MYHPDGVDEAWDAFQHAHLDQITRDKLTKRRVQDMEDIPLPTFSFSGALQHVQDNSPNILFNSMHCLVTLSIVYIHT